MLANDGAPGAALNVTSLSVLRSAGSQSSFVIQGVDQPWLSTGLTPPAGTEIALSASGTFHPCGPGCWCHQSAGYGPDGATLASPFCKFQAGVDVTRCPGLCCPAYNTVDQGSYSGLKTSPAPYLPIAALVGRWGTSGTPFLVGSSATVTAPGGLGLFLAINDWWFVDNYGSYSITATILGRKGVSFLFVIIGSELNQLFQQGHSTPGPFLSMPRAAPSVTHLPQTSTAPMSSPTRCAMWPLPRRFAALPPSMSQ